MRILPVARLLSAGVLIPAGLLASPIPTAAAAQQQYTLVHVGPKDGGGEPSSLATGDGMLYVTYPAGSGTPLFRSADGGATWQKGGTADPGSGDDCLGADQSGGLYLCNLAGNADAAPLQADVWKSIDRGNTWTLGKGVADALPNPLGTESVAGASSNPFGVDRQWVDAWVPTGRMGTANAEVALMYHDFYGPSQIWVNMSTDGGRSFAAPVDVLANPANNLSAMENTALAQFDSACSTVPTAVRIVKNGPHTGRIWVSWIAGDAVTSLGTGCNVTQLNTFHSIWTAFSDDNGATWNPQLAFDGGPGHDASTPFAAFTIDDQGNPYYAFAMNLQNEYDMWLVWSPDGGATWTGPGLLGVAGNRPDEVNADTGTHIYPAIAATDPAHVWVAYLETPTVVPTLPYGKFQPGGGAGDNWYLWVAQGDLTTAHPTWTRTQATPNPMHVGDICNLGIFCVDDDLGIHVVGTNRDLLDFISIDVGTDGMAHVAYTDDNPDDQARGLFGIDVANQVPPPAPVTSPHSPHPPHPPHPAAPTIRSS